MATRRVRAVSEDYFREGKGCRPAADALRESHGTLFPWPFFDTERVEQSPASHDCPAYPTSGMRRQLLYVMAKAAVAGFAGHTAKPERNAQLRRGPPDDRVDLNGGEWVAGGRVSSLEKRFYSQVERELAAGGGFGQTQAQRRILARKAVAGLRGISQAAADRLIQNHPTATPHALKDAVGREMAASMMQTAGLSNTKDFAALSIQAQARFKA
jgi:hypothetical protein